MLMLMLKQKLRLELKPKLNLNTKLELELELELPSQATKLAALCCCSMLTAYSDIRDQTATTHASNCLDC